MIKLFNSDGQWLRQWPDGYNFDVRRVDGSEIALITNPSDVIVAAVGLGAGGWIEEDGR